MATLNRMGLNYVHHTVNHLLHFVDPQNRDNHIKNFEAQWLRDMRRRTERMDVIHFEDCFTLLKYTYLTKVKNTELQTELPVSFCQVTFLQRLCTVFSKHIDSGILILFSNLYAQRTYKGLIRQTTRGSPQQGLLGLNSFRY